MAQLPRLNRAQKRRLMTIPKEQLQELKDMADDLDVIDAALTKAELAKAPVGEFRDIFEKTKERRQALLDVYDEEEDDG